MWKRLITTALSVLVFAGMGISRHADGGLSSDREYAVKAAFIYNFAKYVEWPKNTFHDEKQPLVIGILGEDPFGSFMDVIGDKTAQGRGILIKRMTRLREVEKCHILYISPSERDRLEQILGHLGDEALLSVSDMRGFIKGGGMIHLMLHQNKIRFAINPRAAERTGLHISSRLLELALYIEMNH